jgi:hypothetical protein
MLKVPNFAPLYCRERKKGFSFLKHAHSEALCGGDEFIMDALRIRGQCTCNG